MNDLVSPSQPPAIVTGGLGQVVATLVEWEQRRDLGRLSALRAWWRPSTRYVAYAVLGPLVGGERLDHPVWAVVPALFSLHRLHTSRARFNFGATCRVLAGGTEEGRKTFATHFRRLLACDEGNDLEDLTATLRRFAQRAQAEGDVPINYELLGRDLFRWIKGSEQAREVKTAWAREYYRVGDEEAEAAPVATPPAP